MCVPVIVLLQETKHILAYFIITIDKNTQVQFIDALHQN